LFERAVISQGFGAFDLGLYAAAAKVASIAMMLSIAFQMGWGPFAYSIYKQPDAARTYSLVLRGFSVIMCMAVLSISALSEPLMSMLAGGRYRGAAVYVFPIAMAFGVQAIGWITEIGIHLSKRSYLNLVGFTLFVVISMTGILFLSNLLGVVGVAIGTLAGQIAMLLTSAILAQRACRMSWSYGMPAATVIVTLVCGAAAIADARLAIGPDCALIYAAGIVLILTMNLLIGIGIEDWRRIGNLVRGFFQPAWFIEADG
jgi:O-antigen/teichoic acid export membrane protein